MRIIEENTLKTSIVQIKKYYKNNIDVKDFYKNINTLDIKSLQQSSLKKDEKYIKEISFIMSVINSIIAHPHISNKGEEIILRSDKANNFSEDDFQKTLKDPTLWVQQDSKMTPEYVHYHQYTDEINIYENAFIVLLIDLLDKELAQYEDYYINLLPTIASYSEEIIDNQQVLNVLDKIKLLSQRFEFIKNTYFYKEIHRHQKISKVIKPTNILLKDRLYNYCFKFYRNFIQYSDINGVYKDFRWFYALHILNELKNQGFKLIKAKENIIDIENDLFKLKLSHNDYVIFMSFSNLDEILFDCSIKDSNHHFIHRLVCNPNEEVDSELTSLEKEIIDTKTITIWNLYDSCNIAMNKNVSNEKELAKEYVNHLFVEIIANKEVYSRYCPICKSKNLDEDNSYYYCSDCKAIYTFKKSNDKDTIWLISTRR